jgi:REP element-mobilizing transposase RayT
VARLARIKAENSGAFYHLCGRVAGVIGDYPFDDKRIRRKIVDFIRLFAKVYCCEVLGFSIMGNHYHLVVHMNSLREMTQKELRARASLLYNDTLLDSWPAANWKRFGARVFDVSELMRSLQSKIARWFNLTHNRRGRFWADRFKSVLLEDEKATFDCLLYVELNPVRAGVVKRPEDFDGSSLFYREVKDDKWMSPITEITNRPKRGDAIRDYKSCIYYRGGVPTGENQAPISKRILAEEEARGFSAEGLFTRRIRHFTDGLVIGSEEFIKEKLKKLRVAGQYLRRKNPVPQTAGVHMALRPQRSNV